jgi:hypothetical protein
MAVRDVARVDWAFERVTSQLLNADLVAAGFVETLGSPVMAALDVIGNNFAGLAGVGL